MAVAARPVTRGAQAAAAYGAALEALMRPAIGAPVPERDRLLVARLLTNRANCALRCRRPDAALADAQRSAHLAPEHLKAHYFVARASLVLGHVDAAARAAARLLALAEAHDAAALSDAQRLAAVAQLCARHAERVRRTGTALDDLEPLVRMALVVHGNLAILSGAPFAALAGGMCMRLNGGRAVRYAQAVVVDASGLILRVGAPPSAELARLMGGASPDPVATLLEQRQAIKLHVVVVVAHADGRQEFRLDGDDALNAWPAARLALQLTMDEVPHNDGLALRVPP